MITPMDLYVVWDALTEAESVAMAEAANYQRIFPSQHIMIKTAQQRHARIVRAREIVQRALNQSL